MLESLYLRTLNLPEERIVKVEVEGRKGGSYNSTSTLRELRAYVRAYQPAPSGQSWEYHEFVFGSHSIDISDFDAQGAKGWELVSVNVDERRAFFKRPKQSIPAHICPTCGATL